MVDGYHGERKINRYDITEILLKVALNTINLNPKNNFEFKRFTRNVIVTINNK